MHPFINCRVERARQLDEVQASQKEEMLQLEKKLAEEKELKIGLTQVKVRLEEELRGLKVERQEK